MKTNIVTFEKIVAAEFGNADLNVITKQLAKHKLFDFILGSISQINKHLLNVHELKPNGVLNVAPIGAVMLIKFNEYFKQLDNPKKGKEKSELEYLLGSITKRILKTIIDAVSPLHKQRQLFHIGTALADTCKLYKYDFERLSEFLQIDDLVREVYVESDNSHEPIDLTPEIPLPGFRNCSSYSQSKISRLISLMEQLEITTDTEKMKALFSKPGKNLAIKFNEKKAMYVIQFLAALNTEFLIESDHPKYGFFQVWECHVVNFKPIFLNNLGGQRGADRARKQKDWFKRKNEFDKYFKEINSSPNDESDVTLTNTNNRTLT